MLGAEGEDALPIVTSVTLEGNHITQDHVILRELSHPLFQPFDSSLAHEDQRRLYNLGIFEAIRIYARDIDSREAALVVEVVETIRMIPLPIIYQVEELGWSYGGGVSFLNFRGLNQRLDALVTSGAEKTFTFLFSDPWLFGDRISANAWIMQVYRGDPVYNFRMRVRDLEIGIGKFSKRRTVSLHGAVSIEQRMVHWLEQSRNDTTHSLFQSKIDFYWRATDIWRDPTKGSWVNLYISPVFPLDNASPSYTNIRVRCGWFYPIQPGVRPLVFGVGVRLSHYLYTNHQRPMYLQQYVGSYWVRGYDADQAKNAPEISALQQAPSVAGISLEIRKMILPRRVVGQLELGLSSVVFMDIGWGFSPAQPLRQSQPLVGYGAGLRFFIPIVHIIALDVGGNPYDNRLRLRVRMSHAF
ncbi:BamA/TamA family outer membrane protein [Candidatus Neomarinimicrobiota bacterium]